MIEPPGRVVDAIRNFRLHSLYIRNFIISAALILLPLLGLNIFLYQVSRRMATDEAALLSRNALRTSRDIFDSIFRQADYLAASISLELDTELFVLSENVESILSQDPVGTISARLKTAVYSNAYIHSVYVYSEVSERIITHIGINERSTFLDTSWHETYSEISENRIRKTLRDINDVFPHVITSIKPLYVFGGEQKYGAVVVNIDIDELRRVLLDPDPNSPEDLYVLDDDDIVVFATHTDDLGKSADEAGLLAEIDEKTVILSTADSQLFPWRFFSLHALDTYNLQTTQLRRIITIVLIVSIVATIVAAILISGNSYRPIRRILVAIQHPERLHRLEHDGEGGPTNETRYIAQAIARFTNTNDELRNELHRQLSQLDQARIEALQLQINPHFLNNTLEVMSMSARRLTSGDNDFTRMVALLSNLLQISLKSGENIVPLSEEIEHAKLYLDILSLRYRDRFDVSWEIPDELLSAGMLKLSLQPLLENAFYHGIKPTRSHGEIVIASYVDGNELVATVSNSGSGISVSAMSRVRRTLGIGFEIPSEHIGMRNVDQRARLVFGPKYGLSIENGANGGTIVMLRIPVVTPNQVN
jgi:two-component system, sensor histidine kinase YesM